MGIFPYWFDRLRIFPKNILPNIHLHVLQCYNVVYGLEDPNNAQAGLVISVVGAGAAWFGLYVNSKSGNVEIPKQSNVSMSTSNVTTTKREQPVVMPQNNEAEG